MLLKTDHEFHEQVQSGVETWQKENVTTAPAKLSMITQQWKFIWLV